MTGAVLIGSLVFCFTNFLRNLSGRNWNGVLTQLVAWVSGYVAVILVVHAGVAGDVPVFGKTLGTLNGYGQLIAGLLASSLFGVVQNGFKAIDQAQTSAVPNLIPPPSQPSV